MHLDRVQTAAETDNLGDGERAAPVQIEVVECQLEHLAPSQPLGAMIREGCEQKGAPHQLAHHLAVRGTAEAFARL